MQFFYRHGNPTDSFSTHLKPQHEYLDKYGLGSREDINNLIVDILPNILGNKQKKNKVRNLVHAMSKKDRTIKNEGTTRHPKWVKNPNNV